MKLVISVVVLSLLLSNCLLQSESQSCPLIQNQYNNGTPVDTVGEDVNISVNCTTVQPERLTVYWAEDLTYVTGSRIEISYTCKNFTHDVVAQNTSEDHYQIKRTNASYTLPEILPLGAHCSFTGCYAEFSPYANVSLIEPFNCIIDIDECSNGEHNCDDVNGRCMNTIGSFECQCKPGFTGNRTNCSNVNECAMDSPCDDHAHCNDTVGGYNCTCNGFICTNVDECLDGLDDCDSRAECTDTDGSYTCICNDGYTGDGFSCTDIDECSNGEHNCDDVNGRCMNTIGSFECQCKPGFTGNGTNCSNVDECAIDSPCDDHAHCNDTVGGYNCTCNPGFKGDGLICTNIDECLDGLDDCDSRAECTDTDGSYTCICNDGYTGDGFSCTDIDECLDGLYDCDSNSECTNTIGSYTCSCNDGYTGDGFSCTDIDECKDGLDDCDSNAECTDTDGNYTCICNDGYTGDGFSCTDIDECMDGLDDCDSNAKCTNTNGRYRCTCNDGYEGDGLTCEIGPIIGVLGIGLPGVLLVAGVVLIVLMVIMWRWRQRRRKTAVYSDYRVFFKWRDVLDPDFAPVDMQRRVSVTPSDISIFDNLDKRRKSSTLKGIPEEDNVSDTGSSQPLSPTEDATATTASNTNEKQYVEFGLFDPDQSIETTDNEQTTSCTNLIPNFQHNVPKEIPQKIPKCPPDSITVVLPTTTLDFNHFQKTASSGYVVEAGSEQTASSNYIAEVGSEQTVSNICVVEAGSEQTTSSGYLVEAGSEQTASSGYVVEAGSEQTSSSGYVVEAGYEQTSSSGYVVEAEYEQTSSSCYVVEVGSAQTASSGYIVEAGSEQTASSGYVVEAGPKQTAIARSCYVTEAGSEQITSSGYVVDNISMGMFGLRASILDGRSVGKNGRKTEQEETKFTTPIHSLEDDCTIDVCNKPGPHVPMCDDDSYNKADTLRNEECSGDPCMLEETLYDSKCSNDGYVKDGISETPESVAEPSLLPSNATSLQSCDTDGGYIQAVSGANELMIIALDSESMPWQTSLQGASGGSYIQEPTSRHHFTSVVTNSDSIGNSSLYSPDIYSQFSDDFVVANANALDSDSGYSKESESLQQENCSSDYIKTHQVLLSVGGYVQSENTPSSSCYIEG